MQSLDESSINMNSRMEPLTQRDLSFGDERPAVGVDEDFIAFKQQQRDYIQKRFQMQGKIESL